MPTGTPALGRHVNSSAFGVETNFGVKAASFVQLPFMTHSLQETVQRQVDEVLGHGGENTRDAMFTSDGLPNLAGDIVAPVCVNSVGDYLRMVFGAPETTGAGPYSHVFKSGRQNLPSVSMQLPRRRQGATTVYQGFLGLVANTFRLPLGKTPGVQNMTLGLQGRQEVEPDSAPWDASPTVRAYKPFSAALGKITVNAVVGKATGLDLSYNNNLTARNELDGTPFVSAIDAEAGGCSATLTARYTDEAVLDLARAGAPVPVVMSWLLKDGISSGNDASLTISMPNFVISKRGAPVNGPGGMDLSFEGIAIQSDSEPAVTVTLVNGIEGTEYGAS